MKPKKAILCLGFGWGAAVLMAFSGTILSCKQVREAPVQTDTDEESESHDGTGFESRIEQLEGEVEDLKTQLQAAQESCKAEKLEVAQKVRAAAWEDAKASTADFCSLANTERVFRELGLSEPKPLSADEQATPPGEPQFICPPWKGH